MTKEPLTFTKYNFQSSYYIKVRDGKCRPSLSYSSRAIIQKPWSWYKKQRPWKVPFSVPSPKGDIIFGVLFWRKTKICGLYSEVNCWFMTVYTLKRPKFAVSMPISKSSARSIAFVELIHIWDPSFYSLAQWGRFQHFNHGSGVKQFHYEVISRGKI